MVEDRIGHRYAKSLYGLSAERNITEEVREDILVLSETISGSRDLKNLLNSPLVASSKKQAILDKIFGGALKTDILKHLIEIIVRKGRESYLPNMITAYLEIYDQEHKILRGTLSSAVPLSDQAVQEIKAKMEGQTGQTFALKMEIDPSLIGGFTLRVGDQLFDGSVAGSVRRVKREFIN